MHLRKKLLIILASFSILLSGCEDSDSDIFVDLALDWAHEKGLLACTDPNADPKVCESEPTTALTVWLAGEVVDGVADQVPGVMGESIQAISDIFTDDDDMDPGAEAVLDTAKVAKDISAADALAAEGFDNNDPEKIQAAIDTRPNDWAYQEQLWAYYAANRDEAKMGDVSNQSDGLVIDHVNATIEAELEDPEFDDAKQLAICKNTFLNQYLQREAALVAQVDKEVQGPNFEFLVAQIELVRNKMDLLNSNDPRSPCAVYH